MQLVLVVQAATMVQSFRFITHNGDRCQLNSIFNRRFGDRIQSSNTNAPSTAIGRRALEMTPSDIDMDVGKSRGDEEGDTASFLDEDEDEDDAEEGDEDEDGKFQLPFRLTITYILSCSFHSPYFIVRRW